MIIKLSNIEVEVEQKDIKNMHLAVYPPDGRVHLSMPNYLEIADARSYVASKLEWIVRQQEEIANHERETKREYVSGENHYIFGIRYRLNVVEEPCKANSIELNGQRMTMRVRPATTPEQRATLVKEYMRKQFKGEIARLVDRWIDKIGETEEITWEVKAMKTRWGSCVEKRRHLIFNLQLARVPSRCIEYVVVHELVHLQVHAHNKLFESLLTQWLPNWRSLRTELNDFISTAMEE